MRFPTLRAVAGVLLAAGLQPACGGRVTPVTTLLPSPRPGFPFYEGTVSIDPAARSLRARWQIRFIRPPGAPDSVVLLLNPGLSLSRLEGPGVLGHSIDEGKDPRRITVRLAPASPPAENTLELEYAGAPRFSGDSINGIGTDWVELGLDSFWHPVFHDFSQSLTARVRLELPPGWAVVTSGAVADEGGTQLIRNEVPLIDLALAGSPALRHAEGPRARVYHRNAPEAAVRRVLETTEACAGYLDGQYGAREPLPPVKIVLAPRSGPGYARKNYIVIAGGADTAGVPLKRFVCHEVAHYWSTGAVASGPDNWLNEGFAEFVSARFVRFTEPVWEYAAIVARWRERSEGQPAIWTTGSTARPGPRISYAKAPLLLHRLEERVGSPLMDRILVRYMTEPLRTTALVIAMVGEVAGNEEGEWFRSELQAR
jgi:hypothetical protein